jgi:hypothetical protein
MCSDVITHCAVISQFLHELFHQWHYELLMLPSFSGIMNYYAAISIRVCMNSVSSVNNFHHLMKLPCHWMYGLSVLPYISDNINCLSQSLSGVYTKN